jgi:uncharacterized membrane protein YidH (DUF202 family)
MATRVLRGPNPRQVRRAEDAVRTEGVRAAARMGYAARAVVYAVVGILALMLALGRGGRTTDTRGAVTEVANQPFGSVLLGVLGVGLMAFAAWRFVQALKDVERKGRSPKGLVARGALAVSGLIHASLGAFAFRLLQGRGGGGGDNTPGLTAELMSQPFGRVLVFAVGAVVLGFAGQQLHRAWKGRLLDKLELTGKAAHQRSWVERISRAGVAARSLVFLLMGGFFMSAALHSNPREARGLGGALATLAAQPAGPWLLGGVAVGLVAYAFYQLLEARYRRIPTP